MLIYILIVLLSVILFWGYVFMEKDITSPPVLFVGPFLIASICAAAYASKWNLDLHFNTFCVLLFGCLIFTFACWIVHQSIGIKLRNKARRFSVVNSVKIQQIDIAVWKVFFIILIQAMSLYIVSRDMRTVVGRYGISGDFTTIMYWFREYHMFTNKNVTLSSLSSNIRLFSIAVSYIWIYVICNNYIGKYRNKKMIPMLISLALGVANCVILGARGDAIHLVVAVFVIFVSLQKKYNGWKSKIEFRHIIIVGIALFAIMYGFKAAGDLLGRSTAAKVTSSAMDEVAKYLGAEIKNLDIYLEKPFKAYTDVVPGSQTFGDGLGWISKLLGLDWKIESELPFQKVNGISLGNVYTVFYAYIYDFGYIGFVILTTIMALLSQTIYEHLVIEKKSSLINFRIIVNSYILFLVAFSFFGDWFFTYIFNISMIKYLIIWRLMIDFCIGGRIKVKIRSTRSLKEQ